MRAPPETPKKRRSPAGSYFRAGQHRMHARAAACSADDSRTPRGATGVRLPAIRNGQPWCVVEGWRPLGIKAKPQETLGLLGLALPEKPQHHAVRFRHIHDRLSRAAVLDRAVLNAQLVAPGGELGESLPAADAQGYGVKSSQTRLAGAELPFPERDDELALWAAQRDSAQGAPLDELPERHQAHELGIPGHATGQVGNRNLDMPDTSHPDTHAAPSRKLRRTDRWLPAMLWSAAP